METERRRRSRGEGPGRRGFFVITSLAGLRISWRHTAAWAFRGFPDRINRGRETYTECVGTIHGESQAE